MIIIKITVAAIAIVNNNQYSNNARSVCKCAPSTGAQACKVKNPGRRGVSGTPAQQKLLFVECAELLVFLPKTRFRVDTVVDEMPISVIDRMEESGRAVGNFMFSRLPVHSKARQQFRQAQLFQHANASQGSNADCGRRGTSVQRLPSHLLLES